MPEPLGTFSGFEVEALDTLTQAGVTNALQCGAAAVVFQVTVQSIGTNVVVRFEGSLDGTNYFNLSTGSVDYTLTANGTYGYVLAAPVRYVRLRLVSLSGGTPTVSSKVGAL